MSAVPTPKDTGCGGRGVSVALLIIALPVVLLRLSAADARQLGGREGHGSRGKACGNHGHDAGEAGH